MPFDRRGRWEVWHQPIDPVDQPGGWSEASLDINDKKSLLHLSCSIAPSTIRLGTELAWAYGRSRMDVLTPSRSPFQGANWGSADNDLNDLRTIDPDAGWSEFDSEWVSGA